MINYVTGEVIKALREKKQYTQKQLAEKIAVSDKTVSKWETGRGLPDVSLLEPLAAALNVSVAELLRGECIVNQNRSANMQRGCFYVCPVCGNVIYAAGNAAISCCGIALPPLEAEKSEEADGHRLTVEMIDCDYFLSVEHEMTRAHYISFFAFVSGDRVRSSRCILRAAPRRGFPSEATAFFMLTVTDTAFFNREYNHT